MCDDATRFAHQKSILCAAILCLQVPLHSPSLASETAEHAPASVHLGHCDCARDLSNAIVVCITADEDGVVTFNGHPAKKRLCCGQSRTYLLPGILPGECKALTIGFIADSKATSEKVEFAVAGHLYRVHFAKKGVSEDRSEEEHVEDEQARGTEGGGSQSTPPVSSDRNSHVDKEIGSEPEIEPLPVPAPDV